MRREVDAGRALLLELKGFDTDETLTLTHALSSSPGGRLFSRRLQSATDGNAFFLIETLRHLHQQALLQVDDQGRWSTPFDEQTLDYAELPVPASVRDAVMARVRALGQHGERLLLVASLLEAAFDPALLAEVAGSDEASVHEALAHAVAARLLDEREGAWVFAHDLVQQTLAEAQPMRRRRPWHRRLAAVLQRHGVEPVRVALQHERAGDPSAAASQTCPRCRRRWMARSLRRRRRCLQCGAARGWVWVGAHKADAAAALLDVFETEHQDASGIEQAQALELRATLAGWAGHTDEAVRLYEAAAALLQGVPDVLVTLGDMLDSASRILIGAGRSSEAQGFARRAVATLEAAGEPPELTQALVMDGVCALYVQGDTRVALQRFRRARELARRCAHVPAQRAAILNIVKALVDTGRGDEALAPGFEFGPA